MRGYREGQRARDGNVEMDRMQDTEPCEGGSGLTVTVVSPQPAKSGSQDPLSFLSFGSVEYHTQSLVQAGQGLYH